MNYHFEVIKSDKQVTSAIRSYVDAYNQELERAALKDFLCLQNSPCQRKNQYFFLEQNCKQSRDHKKLFAIKV